MINIVEDFKIRTNEILEEKAKQAQAIMREEADKSIAKHPETAREKTHNLANSIFCEKRGEYYDVGTNISYAKYVLYGRGEVRPKNAKVLKWESKNGTIYAKHSEGVKAHNFIHDTAVRLKRR